MNRPIQLGLFVLAFCGCQTASEPQTQPHEVPDWESPPGYLDPRILQPMVADEFAPEPGRILFDVSRLHALGYFRAAWNRFGDFFSHEGAEQVDPMSLVNCMEGLIPCPFFGHLATFLGEPTPSVDGFSDFCPEWDTPEIEGSSEVAVRNMLDQLLAGVFEDSCDDWRDRNAPWYFTPNQAKARSNDPLSLGRAVRIPLLPAPEGRMPVSLNVPDTRPFTHIHFDLGDVNSSEVALVDIGSTLSALPTEWVTEAGQTPERRLGETVVEAFGGHRPDGTFRVPWIGIGGERIPELTVMNASDGDIIIGQEVLMRSKQVCFDFRTNQLHLGNLSPCKGGAAINSAFVAPSFLLYVEVPLKQGAAEVVIDTGSPLTYCSEEFIVLNDGELSFSVAPDLETLAHCHNTEGQIAPHFYESDYQAILGMDYLLKFQSFGYERAPLRVFFGPPVGEDAK